MKTPSQADTEPRKPGRPRSDEARCAILDSTFTLLNEVGFNELSMEGIASQAGVSKATVYRWWPNKAVLVIDAFLRAVEPELHFTHSEPTLQSIRAQMTRLVNMFTGPLGKAIAAVIGAGQSEPEMLQAFREHWLAVRRVEARELVRNAQAAGEIRPDIAPDTILDMLYGALYFRLMVQHAPLSTDYIEDFFRLITPGMVSQAARLPE
jgi:AcrR family transcriptional regulator